MKARDIANQLRYIEDGPIMHYAGQFRVWATSSQAAQILNQRFRKYPETDFVAEGSEGVFDFAEADLPFVVSVIDKFQEPLKF